MKDPLFLLQCNVVRQSLQESARRKKRETYGKLMAQFGINRFQLKAVLDEIVRIDWLYQSPLLSSLVVSKHTGVPGDGFVQFVTRTFDADIKCGLDNSPDVPPDSYDFAVTLGSHLVFLYAHQDDVDTEDHRDKMVVDFFQEACFEFYGPLMQS